MSVSDWLMVGLIGQAIFSGRFVVQWLCSERRHRSSMPMAFWYLSILGAVVLLGYAVHLRDPVFIVGQTGGLLIYARNVHLRWQEAGRA
ncbi:MAG TPA: lipid-A-disaccharide synthase N-terminal domain-containing protein [Rhodanobacteraceae bacterium]|nr:lipid-A-disaccharide synthase N-terminal domain-containing protein [Rhodanobacteraceae bacterium]